MSQIAMVPPRSRLNISSRGRPRVPSSHGAAPLDHVRTRGLLYRMNHLPQRSFALTLFAALLLACAQEPPVDGSILDRKEIEEPPQAPPPPPPPPDAEQRDFTWIDPANIPADSMLGGLRIEHVNVSRMQSEEYGNPWVGEVRLRGEIEVSGTWKPHFDHPEVDLTCFWVDDETASRIPRIVGDTRVAWFCFRNQPFTRAALGAPPDSGRARIIIDRYQTNRHFSDVYDEAELADVIEKQPPLR